ncbi:MAG: Mur ligase domain-containing protein [Bacteroidia bacterium]
MTTNNSQRIHFIAIGGAAMHNLALALHHKGHQVSGSDDEILEPSRSRLKAYGLLPEKEGWQPELLSADIDAIILGMHARADNPELIRAKEMGLKIYSYPEYLYEQSKDKIRVVIGGSHGKTTITSMILYVLKQVGIDFDFMVGAKLEGFDTMVRLSEAPVIILEGDEYLSSPIDRRPKFHLYQANIGLISGIAWDHINVFPTFDSYLEQFRIFADQIPRTGKLIYCLQDAEVKKVVDDSVTPAEKIPYSIPTHEIRNGVTWLKTSKGEIDLQIFGEHNLMNLEGARNVCNQLGVSDQQFYDAIRTFKGAARRLEVLGRNVQLAVFKDFAHSPSKLKATTEAVHRQFQDRTLVACMELHTFSSLNEDFLDQYKGAMDGADIGIVYFNPHTIAHKKLKPISQERVKQAFGNQGLKIYTDSNRLFDDLLAMDPRGKVFLLMSSGNFDGISLEDFSKKLIEKTESATAH